jgi:hypothetical protein
MIWLRPRSVARGGCDQVLIVEQSFPERAAGEGEADPVVASAEHEIFHVDIADIRRDGFHRGGG